MKKARHPKGATLLVDADILAFEFASTAQRVTYWDGPEGEPSVITDALEDVVPELDAKVDALADKLGASAVIMCLTDTANFRKAVLPTYKANRAGIVRPLLLKPIKEYLHGKYRTFIRPTLEGDDVMGILATHKTLVKGPRVIVSIDKDMRQVPGWLHNPGHGTTEKIDEADGDRWHLMQTLTGDPTDGYKGCPGIGAVKAEAILAPGRKWGVGEMWDAIVATYDDKGLTEADALVQARVARILRASDYDFTKREPILWQPPSQ